MPGIPSAPNSLSLAAGESVIELCASTAERLGVAVAGLGVLEEVCGLKPELFDLACGAPPAQPQVPVLNAAATAIARVARSDRRLVFILSPSSRIPVAKCTPL